MDAAGIIPTDTQEGDSKNVFIKMKHRHFTDKAGRHVYTALVVYLRLYHHLTKARDMLLVVLMLN